MEQFVNDLRDIILGLLHLIVWLVHAIAWIVHAIGWLIHGIVLLFHGVGWLLHHWPWLLAIAAVFLFVVYVLPELPRIMEASGMTAWLKRRKPADELEQLSSSTQLARAEPRAAQRAIDDLVWAVRNNDAAKVNAAIKQVQQTKGAWPETGPGHLSAEITETETKTITVKKKWAVG